MLSFSVTAFCSGTFTPPTLSFAPFASVGSFLGWLSSSEVGSVSAGFLGASSSLAASPAADIFRSLALQALTAWSATSCCRASAAPFPSSLRCHSRSSLALPLASLFARRWPDDVLLLLLVLHRLVDLLSSGMVCRRGVRSGLKNCDAGFEPEMATAPTILAVIAGATTRVHPALATRALY